MIIIRLDRVLADRKMRLNELAAQVGISNVNLSYLKTGKVKAVRFSTLDAICKVLGCQPGDILEYVEDVEELTYQKAAPWIKTRGRFTIPVLPAGRRFPRR